MTHQPGDVIGGRYRLLQQVHQGSLAQLWRADDQLAAGTAVALWHWQDSSDQPMHEGELRQLWTGWQQVLHPQVPRLGAPLVEGDALWLVREWLPGRSYAQLLQLRLDRGLVYGPGEVLLLLRQLLALLVLLHGQKLVHGDLRPARVLRRDGDGLPVVLDFAELYTESPPAGLDRTARGDLQALAVMVLTLMSGEPEPKLRDPISGDWRWPTLLASEPDLQTALARLLADDQPDRLDSAGEALELFERLALPSSTGPVARPEPCLTPSAALTTSPAPAPAQEPPPAPDPAPELPPLPAVAPSRAPVRQPVSRRRDPAVREEVAEGGIWSVLIALVLSAVVGTALGWWWLSRGRGIQATVPDAALQLPSSLPQSEVDLRQQLLNRLRAMQVDRAWFLQLVDASLLARFPERGGRLPGDSAEDASLRRVWNELAEEWLARVEQLPLEIRRRLGRFSQGDWERRQRALVSQGLSPAVLRQLVSGSAQSLLPGRTDDADALPPEPFRQLWFAAAEQGLANVRIEPIAAQARQTRVVSAQVEASGARLFPIRLPAGYRLVLGVNGSPLMQMAVFSADGTPLDPRGPLRVVSLGPQQRSPVQLLVSNDGVAPALITLSLRADPPASPAPAVELVPEPTRPLAPLEPPSMPVRPRLPEPPPPHQAELTLPPP
jgi:serine/threonine-protein kinase